MNDKPGTADQQPAPPTSTSPAEEPRYRGVGGWLLLFCIGLIVLTPLITLSRLVASYGEAAPYLHQFPGLMVVTVIDTLLCIGLMAFSIYAGTALWRIRPGAVRTAKRYLLCFLGYQAVAAILPFMAGLPPEANGAMIEPIVTNAFRGVLFVAIWHSYLNKSKRVSATYHS